MGFAQAGGFNAAQGVAGGFGAAQGPAGEAATPAIDSFTPTSGAGNEQLTFTLSGMPSGWTLNNLTTNGLAALAGITKVNDTTVTAFIGTSGEHPNTYFIITYNTSETVDTQLLTPAGYTFA